MLIYLKKKKKKTIFYDKDFSSYVSICNDTCVLTFACALSRIVLSGSFFFFFCVI